MLRGIDVKTSYDFYDHKDELEKIANKIIFTGQIDRYYDYCFGKLEYRSVRFEIETLDMENFQGNAVVNYTDYDVPYTRIIEHKHFEDVNTPKTIISKEYSDKWDDTKEPYYPINNEKNNSLYEKYKKLAGDNKKVIFGGRLGSYKYYDMDKIIEKSLSFVSKELGENI